MDSLFKAFILPVSILFSIITIGTFGYMHFNHINFLDALQLVVVTLATCGIRQTANITSAGEIFDIVFIIVSFIVMISVISKAFSLVVEGEVKGIHERSKMKKTLQRIKDHYIVCGFGRVGRQVADQLLDSKIPVVVIDSKPDSEERMKELKIPYVIGTLSSDEILKKANIQSAKGLVACADSDVENVFVTLSARTNNPALMIIARASDIANEEKMIRAGANHIVSPYVTTGQKISSMILNPSVADFLDKVLHDQSLEVWFQEIKIPKSSKFIGKTLQESDFRKKTGVIVLAIKHANENFDLTPNADTVIQSGDTLICNGNKEEITRLKKII